MADFSLFQPEITKQYGEEEWKEDIKKIMKRAGMENKPTVFLMSDSQIKEESMLEDIDSLLNSGEVANIFAVDEKVVVRNALYYLMIAQGGNLRSRTSRCATNLRRTRTFDHSIVCFLYSPMQRQSPYRFGIFANR